MTIGLILLFMAVAAFISIKIRRTPVNDTSTGSLEEPSVVLTPEDALPTSGNTEGNLSTSGSSEDPSLPYDQNLEQMKSGTYHENTKGDPSKVAILFGINECSPLVYQGDRLLLKGCVNDSRSTLNYLLKKGFGRIWYNENQDCSIANFLRVWKSATKDLKDGDTLVLQMSRHGMSLGKNVLENDSEIKKGEYSGDQAAVMFDGVIVDDCFWRLFMDLPKVKLIFINDSCHSGSQYKVADLTIPGVKPLPYRKARSVGREYLPKKNNVLDVAQLDKEFGPPKNADRKFDLISISGCQDWETSADAYLNGKYAGAMTYCLLSALHTSGRKSLTEVGKQMAAMLKQQGFEQNPKITVEGDQNLLLKPLF